MARFGAGWIKLYRSAVEGDIGTNGWCLSIWVTLLARATWLETSIIWGGKRKPLPCGSVIFGSRELGEHLGCSKNTVNRWLDYLSETGRISLNRGPRGSHVTILNWADYQSNEQEPGPQECHGAVPVEGHKVTLTEEVKKGRRKKIGTNTEACASGPVPPASDAKTGNGVHAEISDPFTDPSVCHVSEAVQKGWLATFGEPTWIKHELKKAVLHLASNPRKVPKSPSGWARFFTTWMNRGWEWNAQRRPPPGGPPTGPLKTLADLEAEEEARNAG